MTTPQRRRSPGTGSITELPDGRFWARIPLGAKRKKSVGIYATREEAESVLRGAIDRLASGQAVPKDVTTLLSYEVRFFAHRRRKAKSAGGLATDQSRWTLHIATAPFAAMPLRAVSQRDVQRWVDDVLPDVEASDKRGARSISRQTVKHCLNLLRAAFKLALRDELVEENPVREIELDREERVDDPWDFLRPQEQARMLTCEAMPEPERVLLAFGMGTGLRRGEQWSLRLADIHVDGARPFIKVHFGADGKPTKGGKPRTVQLFGVGLAAARRWLELLPVYAPTNPLALAFPTRRGKRRDGLELPRRKAPGAKKQPTETQVWRGWLAAAGVERSMRWYDATRHTFASSLVSGFWGRRWSLEEVRGLMGHTSIEMTQRYAHLADEALERAADETEALSVLAELGAALGGYDEGYEKSKSAARHAGFEPAAFGSGGRAFASDPVGLDVDQGPPLPSLAALALRAISDGAPEAHAHAVSLALGWLQREAAGRADARRVLAIVRGEPTWAAAATMLADALLGGDAGAVVDLAERRRR